MRFVTALMSGALLCAPAMYGATTFTTTGNLSTGDPTDAKVTFAFGNGTLQIVLSNLLVDQNDIGQDLNGILFSLPGSFTDNIGSVSTFSGTDRTNIQPNVANGWTDTADSTNHWFFTNVAAAFKFTTIGNPAGAYTIVGAPNASNKYANANASIDNHDPLLAITATWILNIPGVSVATDDGNITNVKFSFGTEFGEGGLLPPDQCTGPCGQAPAIPEPVSLSLVGGGLLLLGLLKFAR